MFCPSCGQANDDGATRCAHCGASLVAAAQGFASVAAQGGPAASVPNYLVQSILATIFCCLPFGIAAIVFSAQANSRQGAGDLSGALEAARKAKTWCWVAFGVGLATNVGGFIAATLGGALTGGGT